LSNKTWKEFFFPPTFLAYRQGQIIRHRTLWLACTHYPNLFKILNLPLLTIHFSAERIQDVLENVFANMIFRMVSQLGLGKFKKIYLKKY